MATDENKEIFWSFPEFEQHERSRRWWIWFIIIDLALLLFAIISYNYIFALIIVIITGIIIFRQYHQAETVDCNISDEGISLGGRLYEWDELEKFWLAYDPPKIKNLYLAFKSVLHPTLTVPLLDQNPLTIRKFLNQYLEEDLEKEGEPTSEALGRMLKL